MVDARILIVLPYTAAYGVLKFISEFGACIYILAQYPPYGRAFQLAPAECINVINRL